MVNQDSSIKHCLNCNQGHFGIDECAYNQKYYVTDQGHAFTEPMTAGDIVSRFGPIRELEAKGFRVKKA